MADETVTHNLENMGRARLHGLEPSGLGGRLARDHIDDVLVEVHGQPPTHP